MLTWLASFMEEQGREQDGSMRTFLFIADRLIRYMISLNNDCADMRTRRASPRNGGECCEALFAIAGDNQGFDAIPFISLLSLSPQYAVC